jgi:hypothetical protein
MTEADENIFENYFARLLKSRDLDLKTFAKKMADIVRENNYGLNLSEQVPDFTIDIAKRWQSGLIIINEHAYIPYVRFVLGIKTQDVDENVEFTNLFCFANTYIGKAYDLIRNKHAKPKTQVNFSEIFTLYCKHSKLDDEQVAVKCKSYAQVIAAIKDGHLIPSGALIENILSFMSIKGLHADILKTIAIENLADQIHKLKSTKAINAKGEAVVRLLSRLTNEGHLHEVIDAACPFDGRWRDIPNWLVRESMGDDLASINYQSTKAMKAGERYLTGKSKASRKVADSLIEQLAKRVEKTGLGEIAASYLADFIYQRPPKESFKVLIKKFCKILADREEAEKKGEQRPAEAGKAAKPQLPEIPKEPRLPGQLFASFMAYVRKEWKITGDEQGKRYGVTYKVIQRIDYQERPSFSTEVMEKVVTKEGLSKFEKFSLYALRNDTLKLGTFKKDQFLCAADITRRRH